MTDDELRRLLAEATSGPWFVHDFRQTHDEEDTVTDIAVSCVHPDHLTVCVMGGGDMGFKGEPAINRALVDARLIAAAPDLAAEVLRLREALSCDPWKMGWDEWRSLARAALNPEAE